METVKQIIDHVGHERAQSVLGVSRRMVDKAIQANKAPAMWFDALEKLTKKKLPRDLFTFKVAAE